MTRWQLRRYAARFTNFRGRVALVVALSVLQAGLLVPIPLLIGRSIDQALPNGDTAEVVVIAVAMAVLAILSVGVQIVARRIDLGVTLEVIRRLRGDIYARLIELPKTTYDNTPVATLHDTVVQDALRVQTMTSVLVTTMLPNVVVTAGISVVLFILNWKLALVTIAFAPVLFVAGKVLTKRIRAASDVFHPAYRDFSGRALLTLRSQELVRLAGAEAHELDTAGRQLDHLRDTNFRVAFLASVHPAIQQGVIAVAGAGLLLAGGVAVIETPMSLGELLAFYAGFAMLRGPAGDTAQSFASIVEGQQALGRIDALLESRTERPYTGTEQIALEGRMQLVDVTFGYERSNPVLFDVSVTLSPGRIVALVGPNGSGKSSIVNLLLGFYAPDRGLAVADGNPYGVLDMRHLRPQLGVVTQEPFLLPDTVFANITYGRDHTEADLDLALRLSGADGVIERLPQGLDTHVGEEGVKLSGGQRQRIAIARALLGSPKVLIFDEPTNHLDNEAVATLIANLRSIGEGVSVLIVSHRNEVLVDADETIALHGGRIAWRRGKAQRRVPGSGGGAEFDSGHVPRHAADS